MANETKQDPTFNDMIWELDKLASSSVLDRKTGNSAKMASYFLLEIRKYLSTENPDPEYTAFIKKLLEIA